jgi:membrane glycosyltransferase
MAGWPSRWQQRQRDLQNGVDADLLQANRGRRKLSSYFFALVFLLIGVQAIVKPTGTLRGILVALCIVSLVCAVGLARWARAEGAFLSKPDLEKPPSMFK